MIKAEQVEDRRVEVVNVDGIFGDAVAEFVGAAVADAGFYAAAGEQIVKASL